MKSNNSIATIAPADALRVASFNAYYDMFIDYLDTTESTINAYNKNLRVFARWLADNGIMNPTRKDIMNWRDTLAQTHKATTTQSYTVKQFFKWLAFEGLYSNVADNIKGARIGTEHKKDALTMKQLHEVLASFKCDTIQSRRDYALILLCVCGGLRTIEAQRADIGDIRQVGDFMALFIQGKGKDYKGDYVKLPDEVEHALRAYLQGRHDTKPSSPLFASISDRNNAERMTTRSISRIIKNAFLSVGLNSDRLTAHSLRHTTATINLLNGGTLEETQQLLRHASITTTMIYNHALERANNKSENRIANAILGSV